MANSKANANVKTNAMRILESEGIEYTSQTYEVDEFVDGIQCADKLGLPHEQVFKTLVCVGADKQHYVFVIPIEEELDFKKCAKSVGVKAVEMIHVRELIPLTGYMRGGCTAIGMKKQFVTRIDETAQLFDTIYVSGGKIGCQIGLSPDGFLRAAKAEYADLTRES